MTTTVGTRAAEDASHPSGDDRFALVDKHLKRVRYEQHQLIETLHVAQDVFGHLSDDVLLYVARALRLPPSMVYGVATFYQLFTFESPGDHTCMVCTGTACFVKGADDIVEAIGEAYEVADGGTSEDGRLSLTTARCIGSCGMAPIVVVDGEFHGHLDPPATLALIGATLAADEEA
ncbi:MAG: NAD(P)H-dependent oxidoreductase subunit E [Acidimicrobiia bacterium]